MKILRDFSKDGLDVRRRSDKYVVCLTSRLLLGSGVCGLLLAYRRKHQKLDQQRNLS